jgi:amidase
VTTFITRLQSGGSGPRLAVKDLIDMAGVPTSAGCKAVADAARPAAKDAACMAGARAADARIVGKVNPVDPALVPGGSSSGSAVAVASDEADVAYGSDTGGSVRIPSACCGTTGLKTTHGRISIEGVWPLASSLDTVGPMGRDVASVVLGMQLLEPGFQVASSPPSTVGRFRLPDTDPAIDAAIDRALAESELAVVDVELPGWMSAYANNGVILLAEAFRANRHLLGQQGLGEEVGTRVELGRAMTAENVDQAEAGRKAWQDELTDVLSRVELFALPTMAMFPIPVDSGHEFDLTTGTGPVNLAGNPALSMPVPTDGRLPASLQLVGPHNSEAALLALGRVVEAATS